MTPCDHKGTYPVYQIQDLRLSTWRVMCRCRLCGAYWFRSVTYREWDVEVKVKRLLAAFTDKEGV